MTTGADAEDRPAPFAMRSAHRRSCVVVTAWLLFATTILGCNPSRGGWDLSALLEEYPSLEGAGGHRLGDMLPFPAFEGDRVVLLACRFPNSQAIRVAGDGPGWPQEWARLAVTALDRGARGFRLELLSASSESADRGDLGIHVRSTALADGTGPRGLADTLSECDVSRLDGEEGGYRGLLVGSEIRINRSRLDVIGKAREATAEEWVGALLHEIAHALGFSGHAATGGSILVREQSRLRSAGRRVLAGEALRDETLEALYQLRPGQRLGTRPLSPGAISTLREIRELVKRDSLESARRVEARSSVGDWQARVQWQLSDGSRLGVRLLHWRDELRAGGEISLLPDATTRQRLARQREEASLLVD